MQIWVWYTLITASFYAFWGFLPKIATNYLDPRSAMIYQTGGATLAGLVLLIGTRFKLPIQARGITFSMLAGIAGVIGTQFLLMALAKGKASLVNGVVALYPAGVVILAAIFLKETLTLRQIIGLLLSFVAIFLIAS